MEDSTSSTVRANIPEAMYRRAWSQNKSLEEEESSGDLDGSFFSLSTSESSLLAFKPWNFAASGSAIYFLT